MAALGVVVHLDGDAGIFRRGVVDQRMLDVVDRVVFGLHHERGRRVASVFETLLRIISRDMAAALTGEA